MRGPMRTLTALVFAVAVLAAPAATQQRMTPEMLWELGRVADLQLAPDGRQLLYHLRSYDLAANRGTTEVWSLDLGTRQARRLTGAGSNSNARWSPDGSKIAFLSTRDGTAQAYVMPADGGEAQQVTRHDGGCSNLAWSPDGRWLSFTADVPFDRPAAALFDGLPQADAQVYDDLMVRHWDQWLDGSHHHLFVTAADGSAAPRDLLAGLRIDTPLKPFGGGEQIAWSPDSGGLVFTAKRVAAPEASTDSSLWFVSLDGGEPRNLTEGMPGYDVDPRFSPDGAWLAWESMARDGYESDQNRLMLRPWPGDDAARRVEAWDATISDFAWLPDSSGFLLLADQRGTHQIFRIARDGGEAQPVTRGRWHFDGPQIAPDASCLYALREHSERPAEVVVVPLDAEAGAAEGELLTDVNGARYADLSLPEVEERWFDATDGERIHAWIVKPPDFDPSRRYPMLLYCQGGPQSQVGQWFSLRWNFHLMAAQGYVVLAVNRRGLPGFGTAWNEQISGDWGGQAMRDLLSATDAMRAEPWIDRDRVAAVGASFGGYTVYWLMGHDQEDRFAAMIAHCGVFNLESMYLSTEELFFVDHDLGGPYWLDERVRADYARFSPHEFVGEWDTPLLVFHGQRDYRVPVEQGLSAFTAAQLRGLPSRFVYFPGESHWVLSPQNGVLWQRVFFDWLGRHCAAEPAKGSSSGH